MAIYSGKNMPKEVGRTAMDFEVKDWLKDGPVLGSHEPIHVQRRAHDRLSTRTNPQSGRSNTWASTARTVPSRFAVITHRDPASPRAPRSCTCTAAVTSSGRSISSTRRCGSSPRTAARKSMPRLQARAGLAVSGSDRGG